MQAYENLLGNWQTGISEWIRAVTTKSSTQGRVGVHDMIYHASQLERESIAMCNVGSAVLCLRYLYRVSNFRNDELR